MSKKILAFGASSSIHSINKKFARYAAERVSDSAVTLLDLNDYEMPIFSVDKENQSGIPKLAHQFKQHILDSDGLVISLAEHNGAYSAAFKNILDWISRIDGNVWGNKPMLLLSAAPGGHGGKTVLDIAFNKFGRMNQNMIIPFSLPFFAKNFHESQGITNDQLNSAFEIQLGLFNRALNN